MENQVVNVGGILLGMKNAQLFQTLFTFLMAFGALALLVSAYSQFKRKRQENPVFSRAEVRAFIEAQLRSVQITLEDGGVVWDDFTAYQWMLYLCRKIKVRQDIVVVGGKRYEAPGFNNIHEFVKRADFRLGASTDVAVRAEDGTPKWERTQTLSLAKDVQSTAREVARLHIQRRMTLPTEYLKFKQQENR